MNDYEKAMTRPSNFFSLSGEERWAIDKQLGILDWDGECAHSNPMCDKCLKKFNKHFGVK